jgi:hypothetical protein
MITVKEAVASATLFVTDLFPNALDLRLEQVEMIGSWWRVVISFKFSEPSTLLLAMGAQNRLFKEVDVDRESGQAVALRMFKA